MEEILESTETSAEKEACVSDAAQTVNEDVEVLKEIFPELSEIKDVTELNNPTRYAALRDLGLSPEEAYMATASRKTEVDNRSHLTGGAPASAKIPASGMSRAQMDEARSLFKGMSDSEIIKLYTKVNK